MVTAALTGPVPKCSRTSVSLPEVSRRLGHANPAITAAIYSHALKAQDSAAAATLDAALRAAGMTALEAQRPAR